MKLMKDYRCVSYCLAGEPRMIRIPSPPTKNCLYSKASVTFVLFWGGSCSCEVKVE